MPTADENLVNARRALDADAAAPVRAIYKFPQWLFDDLDADANRLRAALQAMEHVEGDRQEDFPLLQRPTGMAKFSSAASTAI